MARRKQRVILAAALLACLWAARAVVGDDTTLSKTASSIVGTRQGERLPEIGERFVPQAFWEADSCDGLIMTYPAQMRPCFRVRLEEVDYVVAFNDSGIVKYIDTRDSAFMTPEGVTTRSTLADVLERGGEEVGRLPGWCYVSPLPSGWNAAWCVGYTCTDSLPDPDTPADWFFKGGN